MWFGVKFKAKLNVQHVNEHNLHMLYIPKEVTKGQNWILPKNPKKLSDKSGTNYLQEISVTSTIVFHVSKTKTTVNHISNKVQEVQRNFFLS